ncbi:hypothetical protein [Opitutus terrae]|uniref:Type II secretion system protein n=1 Tax=Opitutus terrae (strain DSM 11246 / JCM 15787 / PB90-1) TaxID=452637 RepID=B1ZT53_OPITP|nr:hypothetical protein [Opitutus terrae]ACB75842.1 hypothetical protein Oter_2560 [Opitutus terrae PB90-1]
MRLLAVNSTRRRGFTLLALAVAFAAVSVVLALAVPAAGLLLDRARTRALEKDLKSFAAAFQNYALRQGDWPVGDGTPAAIPPGMEDELRESDWPRRSPIGGHYAWETDSRHQGTRYRAVIVIASTPDSPVLDHRDQLAAIDRGLDDGDLATGNFFLGYGNQPTFVLER